MTTDGKKLSEAAVQELVDAIYELIDMLPAQGLFTRQLILFKKNVRTTILQNQGAFIRNVLEPLHYWLHENEIGMSNKKAKSIEDGLKKIGAENETATNQAD